LRRILLAPKLMVALWSAADSGNRSDYLA